MGSWQVVLLMVQEALCVLDNHAHSLGAQPCPSPPALWPGTALLALPSWALHSCLLPDKVQRDQPKPQKPQSRKPTHPTPAKPAQCGAVAFAAEEVLGAEVGWVAWQIAERSSCDQWHCLVAGMKGAGSR